MINHKRIIQWMNVVREESGTQQARILENFWESQLKSKFWLVNEAGKHCPVPENSSIYVVGGWYGILSQLLRDKFPYAKIFNIDIDPICEHFGKRLMLPDDNITFLTVDMKTFDDYSSTTSIVINTSTEHVVQETFDTWLCNVPGKAAVMLQGNNFFDCIEHVRCTTTLEEFKERNNLKSYLYSGSLLCQGPNSQYTRFMTLGYKNE